MRKAPAYQEYASDMIASESFKLMSPAERGMLYSLRLHCWAGGSVPGDPDALARVIGMSSEEVRAALTKNVLTHFRPSPDNPSRLVCPELDSYRVELEASRLKRSIAGTKGADSRWKPDQQVPEQGEGTALPSNSHSQPPLASPEKKGAEQRGTGRRGGEGSRGNYSSNYVSGKPILRAEEEADLEEYKRAFGELPSPTHTQQ